MRAIPGTGAGGARVGRPEPTPGGVAAAEPLTRDALPADDVTAGDGVRFDVLTLRGAADPRRPADDIDGLGVEVAEKMKKKLKLPAK